jgi:polysaccharide biosynthesis/export protein
MVRTVQDRVSRVCRNEDFHKAMRILRGQILLAGALVCLTPRLWARDAQDKPATGGAEAAKEPPKAVKADDPSLAGYIIGEQDVLEIDVWREKELSGTVTVRPDGKITVPLVGEINVVGMTPQQLQEALMEKLQPFVTAPQVTVSVKEINSRKIYLIGQVGRPGVFRINSTTTVSQIIAEAGGLRDFAKRKKIYVLRNQNGVEVRLPFNYDDVIKGQKDSKDIVLKPGDKIIVP